MKKPITKSETQVILFPLHFQKEKKKTKQDLVKKRYMHMNFSPPPQSFANDSVKLKSMKKGGKKIKTPEIEREKGDGME